VSTRRRGKKTAGVDRSSETGVAAGAWRPSPWLVAIALALITVAVYAQLSSHTFTSLDDGDYVTANAHVIGGLTGENVRWALTSGHASNWHPLTWMSLQADVSAFGVNPGPLHVANLAWHVLDTLLLFGLLRAMTGSLWRSAIVAALFGIHPAHVESVAWIAERKDVLSAAFWFGTTWAYVAWVRRPAAWRYGVMLALFALGLMAKPMLVTLPATLLLLDMWPLDRQSTSWSRRLIEKAPLFAMAAASSVVTVLVQHSAIASLDLVPFPTRLANAVLSYGRYLVTLIWPSNLSILYQLTGAVPADRLVFAIVALVAITAAAWLTRRQWPFVRVGWLWYVGTLVPVIGLVQVGMQAMADRYTYIPSIGIFIAIVWAGAALAARARIAPTVAGGVGIATVAILAVVAHAQAETWATNETLWRQAVAVTSDNPRAHIELGVVYGHEARHAEAEAEFKQALRMKLSNVDAKDLFTNLSGALLSQGKDAEAIPQLKQAIELDPARVDLRHQLALAYARVGNGDDAIASWREAVRIDPKFEDGYLGLGVLLAGRGKIDEARQMLTELLRLNPNRADAQQALARLSGK
jgi:Tfp pilus assembly protein PilF